MKKSVLFTLLISFALVISLLSCEQPKNEIPKLEYSTPTIKGTVSLPSGSTVNPADIYVKVMDSSDKTVTVQKVNADKTFTVQGLSSEMKYSILFTSVEPDFANRDISRAPTKSQGVGGWIHDIAPVIKEGNDVGTVKMKPLGTIRGKALMDGASEYYDTTVYIPGTSYIAMTNSDGTFAIYNVPEGTYTLRYTHDGYMPIMTEGVILTCPEDAENPEITVRDVKLISNMGTVEGVAKLGDANDSSVVSIRLESEDKSVVYTSTSSKEGNYTINNVAPGTYRIIVSSAGYISQSTQYFSVAPATVTQVKENILLYGNIGTVTGTVHLSDSEEKGGIAVLISDKNSDNSYTVVSDANGAFQKIVKPGEYRVTASYPGYTSISQEIVVSENNSTSISFTALLPDSGTITGYSNSTEEQVTVIAEDGTPVQTIQSGLDKSYRFEKIPTGTYSVKFSKSGFASYIVNDVNVAPAGTVTVNGETLKSAFGTISGTSASEGETVSLLKGGTAIDTVTTSSDRTYTFTGLEPGKYSVRFSKNGYSSHDANEVTVSEGSRLTVNGNALVSIYGSISGKSAGAGETVYLVKNGMQIESRTTLENREYSFENVQPGDYTVRFSRNGYSSYESGNVSVAAGGAYVVDGKTLVSLYGAVAGYVILSDTDDYSGVVITLINSSVLTQSLTETSAADGSFRFDNITTPGTYLLTYSKDGYVKDQSKSVNVVTGSVAVAENVTLRSTMGTVKGTIQLEGASSYENVTILLNNEKNQYTSTTDQKGEYLINRILPGTYTLLASKDGYLTSTPIEVVVEPTSEKTIETKSLAVAIRSVTGSVTLELLSDYSGALVTATNLNDNTLVYSAITNSNGDFTLAGMAPGEYAVVISCTGYRSVTLPTINIVSSSTTSLPVTNMLVNRGTVSGSVYLEGRSNNSGITVELMRGQEVYATAETDETGCYSFYVPQGNYSGVRYSKTDFAPVSVSRNIALFADNFVGIGDTTLSATHNTVSGTVDVLTTDNEGDVIISFDGVESIASFVTTEDGSFSFDHVPVGSYVMRFRRTDCSDITVPVNVIAADIINLGTVTITPNTATIKGAVILKEGLSSEGVTVSIDMGEKTLQTTTDASGRYEIGGVSIADEYTVTYSKTGWDAKEQAISPKLNLLEVRELPEITLVDTTAPVINYFVINSGSSYTDDTSLQLSVLANDDGCGIESIAIQVQKLLNGNESNIYPQNYLWQPYEQSLIFDLAHLPNTVYTGNGEYRLIVTVKDKDNNISAPSYRNLTVTNNATSLTGQLRGENLHLTKNRSPYIVEANCTVGPEDTLVIDPGCEIRFAGNYSIYVAGTILAEGSEQEKIVFTKDDSTDVCWNTVAILGPNAVINNLVDYEEGSIIRNCNFDGAEIPLTLSSTVFVDNCVFQNSGSIKVTSNPVIINSVMNNGICVDNSGHGLAVIINNIIRESIYYGYISIVMLEYNTIENSSVFINTGYYRDNWAFNHNKLVKTKMRFEEYLNTEKCLFHFNSFAECDGVFINYNLANHDYDVVDYSNNYWGKVRTEEIVAKGSFSDLSFIYDWFDNPSQPRVDYSNWLSEEPDCVGYQGDSFDWKLISNAEITVEN